MKILIADDDPIVSRILASRLRARGWTVELAADAMQALMIAIRSQPDVITLDINMPGGTGVEALKKLKRLAKTSQIPVVVLNGSVESSEEAALVQLGAAAFLRKPCAPDIVGDLLTQLTNAPETPRREAP